MPREHQEGGSPADLVNKNIFLLCCHELFASLGGVEDPHLQEVKVCAPIHLPFNRLQSVDVPLDEFAKLAGAHGTLCTYDPLSFLPTASYETRRL